MKTKRTSSYSEAATLLREGRLVAFPTETVFGLGADATNAAAIERLFEAKVRPGDNPLIVHLGTVADWPLAAAEMTPHAEALLAAFAPGPLTVVLPKHPSIASTVTAGLPTVGLRVPSHPTAAAILREAGVPVAAPSANRSGRPSCTRWESVLEDLDGRIDAVFCEDADGVGIESTVVDCTGEVPVVLRPGAVTLEAIRAIVPGARAAGETTSASDEVRSPGVLHPHYQPRAKVRLVDEPPSDNVIAPERTAYCGTVGNTWTSSLIHTATFATPDDYAAEFYEFLREADRKGAELILVQRAEPVGIGEALLDRQRRAAGQS